MRMISVPRRRLFCKNVTSQRDKLLQESHPAQESATILTQPGKKAQANWYNVDYPEEQCEARKGERRWKPQVIKSCVGKEGEKVEARCRDAKPRHQQRAAEVSGTKSQIHGSKVMKRHNVDAEMLSGNRRTLRKLRQNSIADGSPNMPSSCYVRRLQRHRMQKRQKTWSMRTIRHHCSQRRNIVTQQPPSKRVNF
ncbi:hypothetical protein B9Z55_002369 [Caenorhabditis nigoni]|uniref:Uncharacterized protein n=1 Tax=Caenorhabditis nigoni TaxID=1611254 RepID=A0A2G5VKM0_9PELO|nr:hypothetical protein B9Z55_002369 [Caenorhabditis nigoni]